MGRYVDICLCIFYIRHLGLLIIFQMLTFLQIQLISDAQDDLLFKVFFFFNVFERTLMLTKLQIFDHKYSEYSKHIIYSYDGKSFSAAIISNVSVTSLDPQKSFEYVYLQLKRHFLFFINVDNGIVLLNISVVQKEQNFTLLSHFILFKCFFYY